MSVEPEGQGTDIPMERSQSGAYEVPNRALFAPQLEGGNLDKVRDILFGSYVRDYEKRFVRLEERVLKECSELREEVKKICDSLETYAKTELESLGSQIQTEQNQRAEAVRRFSRDLEDLGETFDKKTAQLAEQAIASQRELRQLTLDHSRTLTEEIRQKHAAISGTVEREVQELRTDKTDRSALAALLMEVAMRLNNEW